MKKYKYTQLLEMSLAFALEKIERLENSKPPLIPDEDPVVKDFSQQREILIEGLGWGKSEKTGEFLANLETTPYSVKATFRKNNSPENEAYFATMKQVQEEVANYPESKRAGVLSITSEAQPGEEDYLDLEAIREFDPKSIKAVQEFKATTDEGEDL